MNGSMPSFRDEGDDLTRRLNPYASPLAEDAAIQSERTRWRIVAAITATVCAAVVGTVVYYLIVSFRLGDSLTGPDAGPLPRWGLRIAFAAVCAVAAFVFSAGRSRRSWDAYEAVLLRKRQLLEEANEWRAAKAAPPASPFADRQP